MSHPKLCSLVFTPAPPAAAKAPPACPLPAAVLETLASRVRGGGMFLCFFDPAGTLAWHDPAAGLFFQRFVGPLLQYPAALDGTPHAGLRDRLKELSPLGGVASWGVVPGAEVAAFAYVEKRQVAGVFVIAARAEGYFTPAGPALPAPPGAPAAAPTGDPGGADDAGGAPVPEEIARVCSRLGLDGPWLAQQAALLPACAPAALQAQARLLWSMARDQARLAGLEQELDSLSSQLANTYEELSLIYQISSGMKITRGAGEFFKQACLDVMDVMSVGGMGVALCAERPGPGAGAWRQEPVLYGQLSLPPDLVHRLANDLLAVLRQRKAPLLVNDLAADRTFAWAAQYARQLIAVPLQRQEQVLGCLFGLDKTAGEFDSVDSKLLNSIANESAIYLENARLFEDVRDLMMGMLHSLTSAVDAKDAYTCGHSERVALLSQRLARQIGLPPAQIERIYMAGLLHDVGKIGVPEAVLQKTGRLTPEEFDHMKKHPQIGAHILSDIKQVEDIIPGVLHHHERYDGKGYPAKLIGQHIPLMGRIICLADCFDAMTSNRTYRRALPLEVALTEIRRCAGTQFDPALAEAFLQITAAELRDVLREHQQGGKQRLNL